MADKPLAQDVIPLDGRLITAVDPIEVGKNFQALKNCRYTDGHPQGIGGMSRINTSVPSTYFKFRAGHHFQKHQPVENHVLTQAYNTGLSASQVIENTTIPPTSNGDFTGTALFTDGSGAGRGRFSDAPGGNVAYANGVEACIWGGNEMRCAGFINYSPDGATFRRDYTEQISNTLSTSDNIATLSGTTNDDSATVLLLHMDGTNGSTTFTDSSAGAKVVTANGNAQISTAQKRLGTASGLFDGVGDYLSTPDHADFYFNAGFFGIDFWMRPATVSGTHYLYYQRTDANNFIYLRQNGSSIEFNITAGAATVVSLSSPSTALTVDTWTHVALQNANSDWYLFINGILRGYVSDADVPANYTGSIYIGADSAGASGYSGYLDEYRVSNGTIHWAANFEPYGIPYSSASTACFMYVGSTRPLKGFKVYMSVANGSASTLSVDYWDGSAWAAVSGLSDGTSSGGISLAQTGSVTFSSTASTAKVKSIDRVVLYWYRVSVTNIASPKIYLITLDAEFQTVKDIWDGTLRKELSFFKFASSTYSDNTVNVFDDTYDSANSATFADIGGLTTSTEYLIAGFQEQMMGIEFHFTSGNVNAVAGTIATVYYWSGSAWTELVMQDGTSQGAISMAKSGVMTWDSPSSVSEFKQQINNALPLYYYKIAFNKTLTASGATTGPKVFFIGGIPAQKIIRGYKFPLHADNRLYLFGEMAKDKNGGICSATNAPDVHNGDDAGKFSFGDEKEMTAGAWLYNDLGSNLRSLKLVTKANETWILEGFDPSTWRTYQLSPRIGCIAPQTMKTVSLGGIPGSQDPKIQYAIWQGAKGVYMSDGGSIVPIHWDIRNFFDRRASDKLNVTYAKESAAFIDYEKLEYHWLFASGSSTTMNREFVYDLMRKKWYEIDRGTDNYLQIGIPVNDADGNNYLYGATETGYLQGLENGVASFDGTAITHTVHTGDIAFAGIMEETTVRSVKLLQVAKSTANNTTITHYVDTATTGTDLAAISPVSTGKRVADVGRGHDKKGVFHSFKAVCSTSDQTVGFEPIAIGIFFKDIKKDLN